MAAVADTATSKYWQSLDLTGAAWEVSEHTRT